MRYLNRAANSARSVTAVKQVTDLARKIRGIASDSLFVPSITATNSLAVATTAPSLACFQSLGAVRAESTEIAEERLATLRVAPDVAMSKSEVRKLRDA